MLAELAISCATEAPAAKMLVSYFLQVQVKSQIPYGCNEHSIIAILACHPVCFIKAQRSQDAIYINF